MTDSAALQMRWHVQYHKFNPKPGDTDLLHFAKTSAGTYEIYDDGNNYLLVAPHGPAELFDTLDAAKTAALSTHQTNMERSL